MLEVRVQFEEGKVGEREVWSVKTPSLEELSVSDTLSCCQVVPHIAQLIVLVIVCLDEVIMDLYHSLIFFCVVQCI